MHLMSARQQKSNRIIGTKVEKFDDTADKNCSSDLSPSPTPTPFTPQRLHQASNFNFFFKKLLLLSWKTTKTCCHSALERRHSKTGAISRQLANFTHKHTFGLLTVAGGAKQA